MFKLINAVIYLWTFDGCNMFWKSWDREPDLFIFYTSTNKFKTHKQEVNKATVSILYVRG